MKQSRKQLHDDETEDYVCVTANTHSYFQSTIIYKAKEHNLKEKGCLRKVIPK